MNHSKPKNREKGISLIIATVAMVGIIPMVGLFVDLGILYASKARLQAAVDGAALAAARSLNLGQSTTAQATNAKQTAVNWFYANFPNGNWSTSGTVMTSSNVTVADDANNAHQRDVTVTATTNVPTYFMRFLHFNSNTLNVTGQAARRDLVAMLVLDRSGSMCNVGGTIHQPCGEGDGTPCDSMLTAAKNFTGQFAEGRDQIGLVSFSEGAHVDLHPTVNFQTQLGYTNSTGSGTGIIDNITCAGGTGTAGAISIAYNEIYKMMLPGALNVVVLETDGLPNTVAYNFNTNNTHNGMGLNPTSGCQDNESTPRAYSYGSSSWNSAGAMRPWTSAYTMGPNGYMADIPAGPIGAIYTSDPGSAQSVRTLFGPFETSSTSGLSDTITIGNSTAPGCSFGNYKTDLNWIPTTDIFGNSVNPSNAYQTVTITSGHVDITGTLSTDWTNIHASAENATDNAAYRVRSNATLPAYFFAIGLGGNDAGGNGSPRIPSCCNAWPTTPTATFLTVPRHIRPAPPSQPASRITLSRKGSSSMRPMRRRSGRPSCEFQTKFCA